MKKRIIFIIIAAALALPAAGCAKKPPKGESTYPANTWSFVETSPTPAGTKIKLTTPASGGDIVLGNARIGMNINAVAALYGKTIIRTDYDSKFYKAALKDEDGLEFLVHISDGSIALISVTAPKYNQYTSLDVKVGSEYQKTIDDYNSSYDVLLNLKAVVKGAYKIVRQSDKTVLGLKFYRSEIPTSDMIVKIVVTDELNLVY